MFENVLGEKEFSNISNFALNALCIPHSNAECERIFSKINLIKTKTGNRLVTKTIKGTLLAADHVKKSRKLHKISHKDMLNNMIGNSQAMLQKKCVNISLARIAKQNF